MKKYFLPVVLLLGLCINADAKRSYSLFDNGKSDYSIVVSPDASECVRFAASELQEWLGRVSGVRLPVVEASISDGRGKRLLVGTPVGDSPFDAQRDAFCWRNCGSDIYLWGASDRGTLYSVYSFLSENFGCRWYTSKISVAPPCAKWSFTSFDHYESPAFLMRDNFWYDAFNPLWAARNRSTHITDPKWAARLGGGESIHGCHTLGNFYVPQKKYIDSHPEYFSFIHGERTRNYAQICLSNPEVLQIVIDGVRQHMREHPDVHIFDVSQNDNLEYCQCEKCNALANQFGGQQSGIMLWFVNQVADAIRDEFPDNYICTFAYQYTRPVPENITPKDNVVIRLCSVEECQLHDFDECDNNRAFVKDLQDWSAVAPKLCIWDYVATYSNYLAPFPNMHTFQSRIKAFRDNGAISVMPQGNYQSVGSIFDELKAYVTSKLLWDPDCDVIAAQNDFIDGVFGPAADYIREYLEYEREALITSGKHQSSFFDLNSGFYPDGFEARGREIFRRAYEVAAGDSVLIDRIERAELPLCYLQLARNPYSGNNAETLDLVKRSVERSGVKYFRETDKPQQLMDVLFGEMQIAHLISSDTADYGDFMNRAIGDFVHFKKAGFEGAQLFSKPIAGWNGETSFYIYINPLSGGHANACYSISGVIQPGISYNAVADPSWYNGNVTMIGFDPSVEYTVLVSDISKEELSFRIVPLSSVNPSYTLFDDGKSDYSIVVSPDASECVRFAASELQEWLGRVSGVRLPVVEASISDGRGKRLFVGIPVGDSPFDAQRDAFCWRNRGSDIYLWGASDRGTLYSVYSFLSENFGCRWYTSKISVAPPCAKWSFTSFDHSESPAFLMRENFWFDAFDPLWAARNRSTHIPKPEWEVRLDGGEGIYGGHTMDVFVPRAHYLDSHPEYFSLRNGVRSRDYAQCCLSNPEVLQMVIEGVSNVMRANPQMHIFDVSQNDNDNFCECEKCQAIANQFGGHQSGLLLWFVNQVADAIKDEFPDNYISTFAYAYTRSVPENIKPRDNVVIRLCGIEECQLHDFDECEINRDFVYDLQEWSKIAPKLCIWDYVGTYFHYLAPLPNMHTFQSRIKAFRDNGAISVMPQGNYQSVGSIFDEMRAYVMAKLMWNPDCDEIAAENDFLDGVFGPAADYIREYLEYERTAIIRSDKHQNSFVEMEDYSFYPVGFDVRGREIFRKAYEAAAGDPELIHRIERAEVPLCYMQIILNPNVAFTGGAFELLERSMKRDGITHFREGGCKADMDELLRRKSEMGRLMTSDPATCGEFKNENGDTFRYLRKAGFAGAQLFSDVFKGWNGDTSFYLNAYPGAGGHPRACYHLDGVVEPGVDYTAFADTSWDQGQVTMSGFDPDTDYTILFSNISEDSVTIKIVPFLSLKN